jgi:uncharacterized protein (TIGR02996 family)
MTEDAFLEAILANEDDDAPRLIFADWLEESGQPERGEFIRCQCLQARLPRGDDRREELRMRYRLLLKRHGRRWAGPLGPWLCGGTFRRGFLDKVTVPAQVYLQHAAEIVRLAPVHSITVDLTDFRADPRMIERIPESVAREHVAIPIGRRGRALVVAIENADDLDCIQKLSFILNLDIELVAGSREQIVSAIDRYYDRAGVDPVARLVDYILQDAFRRRATRVRLEPRGKRFMVSYCVDEQIVDGISPPPTLLEPVVNHVRHLAATDRVGVGRFRLTYDRTDHELGVATGVSRDGPWAVVTIASTRIR